MWRSINWAGEVITSWTFTATSLVGIVSVNDMAAGAARQTLAPRDARDVHRMVAEAVLAIYAPKHEPNAQRA